MEVVTQVKTVTSLFSLTGLPYVAFFRGKRVKKRRLFCIATVSIK